MKSSDIKNWSYELSYSEIVELEDFEELLTNAIASDTCLNCGGGRSTNMGLCFGCSMHLKGKDKEAMEKVLKDYEVSITVKKR
ncbi:hypothetical protein ES705_38911 [subsurface metagenome]|jgi:hypothetical protein